MNGMMKNLGSAYWSNIADEVTQLQEVSAIAPLTQTTHAIVRFQTSDIGPDSEHNLLRDTPNVTMDDDGNVTNFNSITFTDDITENPGDVSTVWYNSDDGLLYIGEDPISTGSSSGDVNGPGSSNNGSLASFSGTSGKIIQDSLIYAKGGNTNIILSSSAITDTGKTNNVILAPNFANNLADVDLCIAIGKQIMYQATGGTGCFQNVLIGSSIASTVADLTDFYNNIVIGHGAGTSMIASASGNLFLGNGAGTVATDNDSCIYIANSGVASEDNTIRIGAGYHTASYLNGVYNNTTFTGDPQVVTVDSNHKLISGTALSNFISMSEIYFENITPHTLALTVSTQTPVNPTTASTLSSNFTNPSAGVLRYIGDPSRTATVNYHLSGRMATGPADLWFYVALNSVQISGSRIYVTFDNSDYRQVSGTCVISLDGSLVYSDITLIVTNLTNNDDLDINTFSLTVNCVA